MMTTIDLSDDLLQRAKRLARREGLTLRALIEEGLRLALKSRERRTALPFRVRPFRGDGFTAEYRDARWEMIRGEIYRGPD